METEGKWQVAGHDTVRERVQALGAEAGGTRQERNLLFDRAEDSLFDRDCTLRLRVLDGGAGVLTFKGPRVATAALKVRPEFETGLDSPEEMQEILEALGFRVTLEYAKTREIWRLPPVEIALDTFYGETFVEIEGPEADVFRVAESLGLARESMDLQSYSNKKATRDTQQWARLQQSSA
jgi:adenylate cyclase class 2